MAGERRLRILSLIERAGGDEGQTARLCDVCAEVAEMTGAGIMLMAGLSPLGSICTSNRISARIEELQYDLGEGPCVDAFLHDRPVLEPDLAHPTVPRWVAFSEAALDAGARAIFGFPLRVGAVRLGALNLYRDRPGPLTDEQHADALVLADVVAGAVLALQAHAPADRLDVHLDTSSDFHLVVHQAAGMVAGQLNVKVGEALIRLRAHAFGTGIGLTDLARAVVARTYRFVDIPVGEGGSP